MARRYKAGEIIAYDNIYGNLRVNSWILNGAVRDQGLHSSGRFYDEKAVKSTYLELVGNEEGKFRNPEANEWFQSALPRWKERLKKVDEDFKIYQQQRVNQGYEKPEVMPENLVNEKLRCESYLDIMEDEKSTLERLLKEFAEKSKTINNEKMLKYGLVQSSIGDPIREIDGQRITINGKGILIIDEPNSPYDGMAVPDYRRLATEWCMNRTLIQSQARQVRHQEIEAKGSSKIIIPFSNKTVRKEDLPKFPEWAINHKVTKG